MKEDKSAQVQADAERVLRRIDEQYRSIAEIADHVGLSDARTRQALYLLGSRGVAMSKPFLGWRKKYEPTKVCPLHGVVHVNATCDGPETDEAIQARDAGLRATLQRDIEIYEELSKDLLGSQLINEREAQAFKHAIGRAKLDLEGLKRCAECGARKASHITMWDVEFETRCGFVSPPETAKE